MMYDESIDKKTIKMETLLRKDVIRKFNEIVEKFGEIKDGEIFYESQLMSKIANMLCKFGDAFIVYEYNSIKVYSATEVVKSYADDYVFMGYVKADEWYTKEQLMALNELMFGYYYP